MRVRVRGLVPRENNRSLSAKRWNKFARVSGSAEGRGEAVCLNGVYPLTDLSEFLIRNTRPSCVSICIYIYITDYFTLFSFLFFPPTLSRLRLYFSYKYFIQRKRGRTRLAEERYGEIVEKKVWRKERERGEKRL